MRRRATMAGLLAALTVGAAHGDAQPGGQAQKATTDSTTAVRRLPRADLENKIRGGWAGQMIGVSYGAPTEFVSNRRIIRFPLEWAPDRVSNALEQDDLYVEMTFAEVLDTVGLDATTEQFGEMFKDSKYSLWHANAAARQLLNRGIEAPWSGHPRYNAHANDIDFQIESDFIGLMTPGLPQVANEYADRVGRVMNYGDGLYGGLFVSGMYAAAFFETDPRKVVEAGVGSIPRGSGYAQVIRDLLDWSAEEPSDWKAVWRKLTDKWDRDDACPAGALVDFNIDARINGAFIALGLIYGNGDFAKTLEISTRAGQDSDCNPSSAAGILGVMLGYDRIPTEFTAGIPKLADTKFEYTSYSLNAIVQSTAARALKIVERAGGSVSATEIVVPVQEPQAPALEQWDVDPPTARIDSASGAWTWSNGWDVGSGPEGHLTSIDRPNGEATLQFHGTGVAIIGRYLEHGGRADVWLDGKQVGEIDAWQVPRTYDNVYWHVTGLGSGSHTLLIRTRPDKNERSVGTTIAIEGAVIYGR
ncbi:MAG: ADP-ribosylglycohydrolase family protein [Luteitalea sp.]|nr:ADP-ribosylglycohydrolase family protein [Luteitalea sp.]